ncbi:s-type anion channel slah1 [Quercus suber]|uniref:S-type anion channel slah1 n=1 Tax=Quercus suber TaxID=58331 RepID=A0AAW0L8I4_QUESU
MATQGSQSEIEVVVEASTTFTNNNQQTVLSIIILKRLLNTLNSILAKFHAGYFRISLSLGSQVLLWKTLNGPSNDTSILRHTLNGPSNDTSILRHVLHILHPTPFLVLWSLALFILVLLSLLYLLKCLFHFNTVKTEFLHNVGVNYLFAPWISWLLLLQSAPFIAPKTLPYLVLWWVFVIPLVLLDVKIYGQWFTKGKRFLSTVANPTSQLSVIGNLVGAQAAASMGWQETSIFLFSIGIVHYFVLFVTLYQHFSGGIQLPGMLSPVFFLYFAAPSVASLAWESIAGAFDIVSKMLFFLSLFLFTSLVFRPNLFKRSMRRFNVAWWAYSFPLTVLALASTEYAQEVKGSIAHILMLLLLAISVLVLLGLMVFTLFNTKMLLSDNDPIVNLLNHLPRPV